MALLKWATTSRATPLAVLLVLPTRSRGSWTTLLSARKRHTEKVMAMPQPLLPVLPVPAGSKLRQHVLQPHPWLHRREHASGDLGHILSQGSSLAGSKHYYKHKDRKYSTYWNFPVAWPGPVLLLCEQQLQPPNKVSRTHTGESWPPTDTSLQIVPLLILSNAMGL